MQKNRKKSVENMEQHPLHKIGDKAFFIDTRNGRVVEGKICFRHTDSVAVKTETNKLVGEKSFHIYTLETSRGDMKVPESGLFSKFSEACLAFTRLYIDWLD